MTIKQFAEEIITGIINEFGERYSITTTDITKNNGVCYLGLSIRDGSSGIAPIIYLEQYYDAYNNGFSINEIIAAIIRIYNENREAPCNFDSAEFMNWDTAKNHIRCKIINREKNSELLETIPWVSFLDLAVVFYYGGDEGEPNYSILIHDAHMNTWGVTVDELYSLAMNHLMNEGGNIRSLYEILRETKMIDYEELSMIYEDGPKMFVMTNRSRSNGASTMLRNDLIKDFANKINKDLIILPSSIHECILVPFDKNMDLDSIGYMIREVNATALMDVDYLSDHPYFFARENMRIEII